MTMTEPMPDRMKPALVCATCGRWAEVEVTWMLDGYNLLLCWNCCPSGTTRLISVKELDLDDIFPGITQGDER